MSELSTELAQPTGENPTSDSKETVAQDVILADVEQDLTPLTAEERTLRITLEERVEKSLADAGEALIEIKNKKLYRIDEDGNPQTWDEYCHRTFNKSKQYMDKLIRAGDVQRQLVETKVSIPITKVGHLDAMSGLGTDEVAKVAETATENAKKENRKPKTLDFQEARLKLGKPKLGRRKPESKPKKATQELTTSESEQPQITSPSQHSIGSREPLSETKSFLIRVVDESKFANIKAFLKESGINSEPKSNEDGSSTFIDLDVTAKQQSDLYRKLGSLFLAQGPMTIVMLLK